MLSYTDQLVNQLREKYAVTKMHVYYVMGRLGIYPDMECDHARQVANISRPGKLNRHSEYVDWCSPSGKSNRVVINEKGIRAIEKILIAEKKERINLIEKKEETMNNNLDMISQMLQDEIEKATKESNDRLVTMTAEYEKLDTLCSQQIKDIEDKDLEIKELKEMVSRLMSEKKELSDLAKLQDNGKDLRLTYDQLAEELGKIQNEINSTRSELREAQKQCSEIQIKLNKQEERKANLTRWMNEIYKNAKCVLKAFS